MANIVNTKQQGLAPTKQTFSSYLNGVNVRAALNNAIGKDAQRFVTAILSAVSVNPSLQECDYGTIISAALLGEGLKLSPSPQLGQYYLVPSKDKSRGKIAQFQIGYKGYIQLAIRSGQYRKLNVLEIKQGELVYFNAAEEEIKLNLITDEEEREKAPTIGYYAMFEYLNGFRKAIYWSHEKMVSHADRYSQAFSRDGDSQKVSYSDYVAGKYDSKDEWRYSSFWYKDFDAMAKKTMLRQLISKWGIMSIDMQKAFDLDGATTDQDGSPSFVDEAAAIEPTPVEPAQAEHPTEQEQAEFDFFGDVQ